MFLFNCCRSVQSNKGYAIKRKQGNKQVIQFVQSLSDIKENDKLDPLTTIQKIQKSEYDELVKQYKGTDKKWTDMNFQPEQMSLGLIHDLKTSQWKRVSDILNKPALFDGVIEPKDVIQGSLGDCYFLSALSALAQQPRRIKQAFGDQQYNPNGIYKVTLRIDGIIQQILVDDYIPVNSRGQPLFCQPNKNQFWVLIMEKAWAKAHGSYANIVAGNPTQVLKAVTYAPSQLMLVKQSQEQRQKLWRIIQTRAHKNYPCCCGTSQEDRIDWQKIRLVKGHAYTLIHAAILKDRNGKDHHMMILRNPWGNLEWQGEGNEFDHQFWDKIQRSMQKVVFEKYEKSSNDGIFFMTYGDFCKYFTQVHFCMVEPNGNYITQELFHDKKHGSVHTLKISKAGEYTFEIHQDGIRGEDQDKIEDGLCRSTLLLAKINDKQYQFVDAIMKYNEEDTTLPTYLQPGDYILYSKLDPTRTHGKMPNKSSVSVYSKQFTDLVPSQQKAHPELLKKIFLNYARKNKRQSHNHDQMWVSWKLLFQQGGFAYIAFGNNATSNRKFVVTFDEHQFESFNFKMKKPFKGKGNQQVLEVIPGQQVIILSRVCNKTIKSMKFPPHSLSIKMQKVAEE